jgi:lipopolysaccharide assembly protein B
MSPDWTWLLLLLPVAFASGWLLAGRRGARISGERVRGLSSTYFRGLNYLLNEQPDKAIEVFLQIAEVDQDTVETHFALGNLFRRRGEVERAIRVHQNLIARHNLSDAHKTQAVLELGEDYMRAGLLDRAETLFSDLVKLESAGPKALKHLISIYQAEREWEKAIEHARRFESASGEPTGKLVAHFHCELAEQARARGDLAGFRSGLESAFEADPHCVRAGILRGRAEAAAGDDVGAIRAFERVARHDVEFLPEVQRDLLAAYERRGETARARAFLAEMIERYPGVSPLLALTRLIEQEDGRAEAVAFLVRQLRQRPSVQGQRLLIELSLADRPEQGEDILQTLKQLTEAVLSGQSAYRCGRCGFGARQHHWQCPSCKNWGTVKPIHGASSD